MFSDTLVVLGFKKISGTAVREMVGTYITWIANPQIVVGERQIREIPAYLVTLAFDEQGNRWGYQGEYNLEEFGFEKLDSLSDFEIHYLHGVEQQRKQGAR